MFKCKVLLPILSWFILALNIVDAQQQKVINPEPYYINYTTKNGLPSAECHHIIQDQKGYIWIATDNGVSRFDGYGFRNFSSNEGLKNNVVFYLQEDQKGRIWMLTLVGNIYYYDYAKDSIHSFIHNDKIQKLRQKYDDNFKWINPFYIDSEYTIYIGIKNIGVFRIKENGDTFLYQSDELAASIVVDVEDVLIYAQVSPPRKDTPEESWNFPPNQYAKWIYYKDTIPYKKKYISNSVFNTSIESPQRHKSSLNTFKKLQNGYILAQSAYSTYLYDKHFNRLDLKSHFSLATEKGIVESKDGRIFLGEVRLDAIYEFNDISAFYANKKHADYLKSEEITSIHIDQQDGLWATTATEGIFYSPNSKNRIINTDSGLDSDHITAFTIGNNKRLLIGTRENAIYELDLNKGNLIEKIYLSFPGTNINNIYRNKYTNHKIWFSSAAILTVTEGKPKNIVYENSPHTQIENYHQFFRFANDKKHIWSWGKTAFAKISIAEKEILFCSTELGIYDRFRHVLEDNEGRIWLGTINGLFEFRAQKMVPQNQHPAFSSRVETIQQLSDSTLVIGTKGAGVLFWKAEEIIQVNKNDGLSSNMIENLYIDSLQRVWVGTSEGLNMVYLNEERKALIRFSQKNGWPANEITQIQMVDKDVWIATTEGIIKLPDWKIDSVLVTPIIEKIVINGEVSPHIEDKPLVLDYQQNYLQIQFLSINFKQQGTIPYRYRLAPVQKDWAYTENRRVDFSVLDNKAYILEVQSQNQSGFWSNSAVLEFEILAPFWEQLWFHLSLLLLGGVIAFGWIRNRENSIKKEADFAQKIAEAEQFALRSQMNPHFIFNCLASIQGYIATGKVEAAIHYLAQFSQLIRTALHFMDKPKIYLAEEVDMITNYLDLEKMRFQKKFDYKIEISKEIDIHQTEIPPLMVQPFIENAIFHAFVGKKKGGWVNVEFTIQNKHLIATIEDNGIGIQASIEQKGTKVEKHKSVGTKIITRRLALKKEETGSNLKIIDLKTEEESKSGTRIIINFGLLKD